MHELDEKTKELQNFKTANYDQLLYEHKITKR